MEESDTNKILENRKMSGHGRTEIDQSLGSEKALKKICAKVLSKATGMLRNNFKSPSETILDRKHDSEDVKLKSEQY